SSQSRASATLPDGASQPVTGAPGFPNPSESASRYQVGTSTIGLSASSTRPSQSSSMPSHTSGASGFTSERVSSQSPPLAAPPPSHPVTGEASSPHPSPS